VIEQSVDTGTSAGRAFFGMLAVFAQFETDVRRERQAEGIATAKGAGVYTGGKPRISPQAVLDRLAAGDGPAAVARALRISRMSVYRIMAEGKTSRAMPVVSSRSGKPRRLVSADAG
jgi:DNA invertase Pin-like site-specific DNA recombinase